MTIRQIESRFYRRQMQVRTKRILGTASMQRNNAEFCSVSSIYAALPKEVLTKLVDTNGRSAKHNMMIPEKGARVVCRPEKIR